MAFHGDQLVELSARAIRGEDVGGALVEWLTAIYPPDPVEFPPFPTCGRLQWSIPRKNLKKKQKRREEYRRVQRIFRHNPTRAAREVLAGREDRRNWPSAQEFECFWRPLFETESTLAPVPVCPPAQPRSDFDWLFIKPFSEKEVVSTRLKSNTAAGPDGISPRQWNAIPVILKSLFLNLLMLIGRAPPALTATRTVFIFKGGDPLPKNYRPISVASVALRHFHKILAARLSSLEVVGESQRAFKPADGVGQCLYALQTLIWNARSSLRPLFLAKMDVAKAFDTVSRHAIVDCLRGVGVSARFVEYISRLYEDSNTRLQIDGTFSSPVMVRRGVRQGDPLSPLLFSIVVDFAINNLPQHIGVDLSNTRISALAFADDILLVAQTKQGLQTLLESLDASLSLCGLQLNPSKSTSFSLVPSGKDKKSKLVNPEVSVRGVQLPAVSIEQTWCHLGVDFQGKAGVAVCPSDVGAALKVVAGAPLKPQQRLLILTRHIIPSLSYGLVFGRVTLGKLRQMDRLVRAAIRRWLRLPHDVPLGFFHAPIRHGGLGVPSLAASIPALRLRRLRSFVDSPWRVAQALSPLGLVQRQLAWCERVTGELRTSKAIQHHFAQLLHQSVDGKELRHAAASRYSTDWLQYESAKGIPAADFLKYIAVRAGALPSRIRTTRGRRSDPGTDVTCRSHCGAAAETTAHIVQVCPRTHGGRIKRHDAVCNTLAGVLRDRGWGVEREAMYTLSSGRRLKPDIVAERNGVIAVVDAQIISGAGDLERSHREKVAKYNLEDLKQAIAVKRGMLRDAVSVKAATISWRGLWSKNSVSELLGLGVPGSVLRSITTRVLFGAQLNFSRFMMVTSRQALMERTGVG
ncbi:hypothetical protein AAG570_004828 [Ranatra chinensis]|uniref:Reverse transcriptase domain-containing protein n=1 Tax=Ranatra chinensis TaxID=642074 RepID=A0ABD0YDL1_9HEMI